MNKNKVIAIIQARRSSTRLPDKIFKTIKEKPLIHWIISRVSKSQLINKIIVATTKDRADDKIISWVKNNTSCETFRGSKNNVLARFYNCAIKYKPKYIVRITADDPFKDPRLIDKAIRIIKKNKYDYCSNTIFPTYPDGLDIEVFTFLALKKAFKNAKLKSEEEHVTSYIWRNPKIFKLKNFLNKKNYSKIRLTIDTKKDYKFINRIIKYFKYDIANISYKLIIKDLMKNKNFIKYMGKVSKNYKFYSQIKNEKYKNIR